MEKVLTEKYKENNIFYIYVYLDPRKPGSYVYGDYSFDYEPFYIGKGCGFRNYKHLNPSSLKQNSHKNNKIKNIIKETENNPIIILKECDLSEKEAFDLEIKYIKTIGRNSKKEGPLTNIKPGGDGEKQGKIRSEEIRKKISKSKIGVKNPMYGKKVSIETRKKMSNNSNMKKLSIEERQIWGEKRSGKNNPNYGNHLSEESKEKLKKANSGENSGNYGKKLSEEVKKNLSITKTGEKNPMYGKKGILSPNIKNFKLTNPIGKIFYTPNGLTEFCNNNNLSIKNMSAVARGKRNHHKGWKCEYI